jgi:hypothetical protein
MGLAGPRAFLASACAVTSSLRGQHGGPSKCGNRFGDYVRERVIPDNVSTPARRRVWSNMTALSDLWNQITEDHTRTARGPHDTLARQAPALHRAKART